MAKREVDRLYEEDEEEERSSLAFAGGGGDNDEDDDDDEANEDLSLRILEKALSRRTANQNQNGVGFEDSNEMSIVDLCASSSSGLVHTDALLTDDLKKEQKVKKKKKRNKAELKTVEKAEIVMKHEQPVGIVEGEKLDETAETVTDIETIEPMDQNPVVTRSNTVLQKLLRGPRYFDPPDSNWETCYNCGEEGHMAVNCPSATKRKKPCFVCGSLEHGAKQCPKALDCYICKEGGHRAKNCPHKHKSGSKIGNICLRCGEPGHDMYLCKNDYSCDDLKDIQCYVCRSFGHLCCVNSVNSSPREVSCYKCGQLGHTGLACGRMYGDTSGIESPSSCYRCRGVGHFARECPNSSSISSLQGKDSPSACYKCGELGHYARDCFSSPRIRKRNHELSTPTLKRHRRSKDNSGHKSAPVEHGGKSRRKRTHFEERDLTPPPKPRKRGGWITDDPEDFSPRKTKSKIPKSPSTPSSTNHRLSSLDSRGRSSGSQDSKRTTSHHKYSASRFGNDQNDDIRTHYRW